MNQGIKTIIFPVRDIARAKALYSRLLGLDPFVDEPYYVGFMVGDQQIGLNPNGHNEGMTGPIAFSHVDDMQRLIQSLTEAGAQVVQEPKDVGGGRLTASLKDTDGNVFGLIQG
jgi:predicted enzyme related to lactoylglutathione lyase